MPATALAAALTLLGPACGGTLEGKYRRGELTSSTTTAPRPPPTTSSTAPAAPGAPGSTSSSTTAPTSGNAVRGPHG
jgi:hypothetical protein